MLQCNALTNGLTILPNGKVVPCCNFEYSQAEDIVERPLQFKSIKESFANNIKHPACAKCWQAEDFKLGSLRTTFYNSNFRVKENSTDVVFLDIRNNNLCNLTCRMCGPMFSSKIGKAQGIEKFLVHAPLENYLDYINFEEIRDIYFTGGEPFLNIDHWKVMDSIPDPSKVALRYNSNLTVLSYKDRHIFDYWKKFKHIWFQTSLEGVGDFNSLIRVGSDWKNIEQNLESLYVYRKQNFNLTLGLAACISILNVWDIGNLIDYAKLNNITINPIYLTGPQMFSLSTLPPDKKPVVKQILENVITTDGNLRRRLNNAIERMMSEDTSYLYEQCIAEIQYRDSLYNSNLYETIKQNLL